MGHFIEGEWQEGFYKPDSSGAFVRTQTVYRNPLEKEALFKKRYLLYVSLACPWAHRTLIARSLLGLKSHIDVAVVDWLMDDNSWSFNPERPGCTPDPLFNSHYMREVYLKSDPKYTGRVTVPVCWDKEKNGIVNNESREILRSLAQLATQKYDLGPNEQVDEIIDKLYNAVNNGVYRAGFATSQGAYDEAVTQLFQALEHWESVLGKQPFLAGQSFSEADICFFTTLIRFDPVYFVHFKCSHRRIVDYPNLWAYLRSIYQMNGVAETCNMDHIRHHYYESHRHINPFGIVARIPAAYLNSAHDRWQRFPQAIFPA
ncbi:glutathione-dependent reductase [bacterium SCN 62-11]|nr:glutathione S-transferase C-terminal domain-containing protein [Candidatus Eremiobacteraeota bacterium]ODT57611.1 MAG: glutathione-dependent reductase [bacterium SCN 62-11]